MSDDFDFDDFDFDDSFLNEVDNITARAASSNSTSTSTSILTKAKTRPNILPIHASSSIRPIFNGFSRPTVAGPSRPTPKRPPPPSSDDFDDLTFPEESLAAFDIITSRSSFPATHVDGTTTPSNRQAKQTAIPSSRLGLGRSSSSGGLQTHLNFRRENQSTKGKRWDRTAFAESGRRINVDKKGKGKGKAGYKARSWGRDDDEEDMDDDEEEEEEDFEPLVPGPKPFVDPSKSRTMPCVSRIQVWCADEKINRMSRRDIWSIQVRRQSMCILRIDRNETINTRLSKRALRITVWWLYLLDWGRHS